MPATYPAYLELYESGELARRAERAVASLEDCTACPRDCHVDRHPVGKNELSNNRQEHQRDVG